MAFCFFFPLCSLFTLYYAYKTLFSCSLNACMHDHHWWAHGGICRPNPQWGHRGSSRCCFMAAFVPHAACLTLRVGNGAIMRCMHAHVLPARARERESLGEVSCMHACLGACWARALLVGLGCPSCKKDRKPHKGKPGSKSEERERDGDGNTTIRLQAMDLLLWSLLPLLFCSFDLLLCVLGSFTNWCASECGVLVCLYICLLLQALINLPALCRTELMTQLQQIVHKLCTHTCMHACKEFVARSIDLLHWLEAFLFLFLFMERIYGEDR